MRDESRHRIDSALGVNIVKHMQRSVLQQKQTYSTDEVARELGLSKSTLLRWFREGRISDVKRDRNNWRVFTPADIERIRKVL
jgi:excisionase family DNA binding protein